MYISESQIVETGYTQGNSLVRVYDNQLYKGFYHKDNQGRYWTEKTHTSKSMLLRDVTPKDSSITLNSVAKNNSITLPFSKQFNIDLTTSLLKDDFILPTESDYNNGYFVRYIAELKNSIQSYIIEINYDSYKNFLTDKNLSTQYNNVTLLWQLTGPILDVYNNNIRIKSGVKDTNLRSIQEASKTIKNISLYLTDPLQFVAK
jgi:hypothetical protein